MSRMRHGLVSRSRQITHIILGVFFAVPLEMKRETKISQSESIIHDSQYKASIKFDSDETTTHPNQAAYYDAYSYSSVQTLRLSPYVQRVVDAIANIRITHPTTVPFSSLTNLPQVPNPSAIQNRNPRAAYGTSAHLPAHSSYYNWASDIGMVF